MDEDRDRLGLEREARQVEDELHRLLAAQQAQPDCGTEDAREHQRSGIPGEHEHADHQRDLAQRKGLRLLAEVDEYSPPLAGSEAGHERRDDEERRRGAVLERGHADHVHDTGRKHEDDVQHPDGRGATTACLGPVFRAGPGVFRTLPGGHHNS